MAKAKAKIQPIMSEQDYRAQADARTLAEAAGIKADKKRLGPAMREAAKMADAKMAEAKELKRLGGRPRF